MIFKSSYYVFQIHRISYIYLQTILFDNIGSNVHPVSDSNVQLLTVCTSCFQASQFHEGKGKIIY